VASDPSASLRTGQRPARRAIYLLTFYAAIGSSLVLGVGQLAAEKPPTAKPRVVLVFLDGAADWLVDDYLARGVLPADGAFAELVRTGVRAEAMVPPDASLTATSHYTMLTGAWPETHGIVSNTFHLQGEPISRSRSGFDASVSAETLTQAARRQGKRVVSLAAMDDGLTPERSADLTLGYGRRTGPASVVSLHWQPAYDWKPAGEKVEHARELVADSTSPGRLALRFHDGTEDPLYARALDTVFDGAELYDSVALYRSRCVPCEAVLRLRPGEWAPAKLPALTTNAGSWMKLLELRADLSVARLYIGALHANRGRPAEFVRGLNDEFGFWPGDPDNSSLNAGLIDEATWLEQSERLTNYLEQVQLRSLRRGDFDLLILYLPLVDEIEHRFLLRDPRQPGYADEAGPSTSLGTSRQRARTEERVREAYRRADRYLRALLQAAPAGTTFVAASDHGMIPVHTNIAVNALLGQAGFRVTRDDSADVRAYASASTAHVYLNLAGREPKGVVPKEKYEEYVERIAAAARALRDPSTGEPVFERVLKKAELGEVRLGHPQNAGDLWLNARPGYRLTDRIDPKASVFQPATADRATHGYLGENWDVQAIFFAAGPGLRPGSLGVMRSVDVAPTVAALLGIRPPRQSQGRDVLALGR
jgi:predicted AlkP superfamily pyrophosphatase or phosphodiesterase